MIGIIVTRFWVLVQFAWGYLPGMPSEASPPDPLSVTGEGENSKNAKDLAPLSVRERGRG
jgi:hypothetical protein